MRGRPTLVTTTDPDLLEVIKAIEVTEKRTRASVVEELLLLGIAARRARGEMVRVDFPGSVSAAHAQKSTAPVTA